MKILFVELHNSNPFNVTCGSIQRSNLLIQACAQISQVDVAVFDNNAISNIKNCNVVYCNKISRDKRNKIREVWRKIYCLFGFGELFFEVKNKKIEQALDNIISKGKYDRIIIRYIPDAVKCGLIKYADRLIVDVDDSPVSIRRNRIKNSRTVMHKWYNCIVYRHSKKNLTLLLSKLRHSFFSNKDEIIGQNSSYLPNIPFYNKKNVDFCTFNDSNCNVLFVGYLTFGANINGLNRFFDYVYPLVVQKIPNVTVTIVGKCNFDQLGKWRYFRNVIVKGFVEDLDKEYADARVVIAPIYEGAGTNIKILEAMQMHRPCVTTLEGARGFTDVFTPNVDYLVSVNDNEFADNVISLLQEPKKNQTIARNADLKLKENFSQQAFFEILKRNI
jgi:glycosyltransferase, group 1 family